MESSFKVDNLRGSTVFFIILFICFFLFLWFGRARHKTVSKNHFMKTFWNNYVKKGDLRMTQRIRHHLCTISRVSVQGVKSLGGHFACLCRGFEFYEVKKINCPYFSIRKWKYFYTFYHFYSEKSSKRAK